MKDEQIKSVYFHAVNPSFLGLVTVDGLRAVAAAVRAETLEEAAKICDRWTTENHVYVNGALRCAADIRALAARKENDDLPSKR